MAPGALGVVFKDRPSPFDRFDEATEELVGHSEIPLALRYFGGARQRRQPSAKADRCYKANMGPVEAAVPPQLGGARVRRTANRRGYPSALGENRINFAGPLPA
jgi:hypothetical protein